MWELLPPRVRLVGAPCLNERNTRQLAQDFDKFRNGLPRPLEAYILATYGVDLASEYAGLPVKNPFGKASGQLSLDLMGSKRKLSRSLAKGVLDLATEYAGLPVKNPFGKASGQLSLAAHQIERDAAAGLGFVILKTLVAEDPSGRQSMREWAIPETRMLVEPIHGRMGGEGWTVTWKGRGWFDSIGAYRHLFG